MKKNTNRINQSESAKKILVINCGGTISMCKENNVYIPKKGNIIKTIKNYPSIFCELTDKNEFCLTEISTNFRLIELDTLIDSSNLYPEDWIKLVSLIENYSFYDGFVILHGTDTLAYTAAALSFMIQNFNKPIIVTGSQKPLIEPKSDGLSNFVGALIMANDPQINQTCVFFGDKLFLGNRVKKFSSVSINAFISPNFPVLGSIPLKTNKFNNLIHKNELPSFHKKVSSGIKIIKLYPGSDLEILQNLNKKNTKALILETFGSGNAPTNQNFLSCLKKLVCENILIINVTQCLEGFVCDEYETGNELSKIGIISGKNITTEAAYAKLHFLFSCFEDVNEIKRLFLIDFVNEMND